MAEIDIQKALMSMLEDLHAQKKKAEMRAEITRKALFSMLEDIKNQKDELEKAYSELKEKTIQLIQTEKIATLGELIAGITHELNQPLNVIKIICQSTLRDIKTNEAINQDLLVKDLNDIISQVNKMSEIINHMRIFTRRTEGTLMERININTPIEGVFKIMGQQLRDRNIDVVTQLSEDLYVKGDGIRLEQVFMNLITNARDAVEKARKEEGMKIIIRTYKRDGSVIIEVEDNGIGIPERLKEKIFEPFYTTKEVGKGTGLGLSISKQIIEEHNGRIEVESEVGKGTIFRVVLPEI